MCITFLVSNGTFDHTHLHLLCKALRHFFPSHSCMLSMMEEVLSALNVSECAVSLLFSQTFLQHLTIRFWP